MEYKIKIQQKDNFIEIKGLSIKEMQILIEMIKFSKNCENTTITINFYKIGD